MADPDYLAKLEVLRKNPELRRLIKERYSEVMAARLPRNRIGRVTEYKTVEGASPKRVRLHPSQRQRSLLRGCIKCGGELDDITPGCRCCYSRHKARARYAAVKAARG